MRGNKFNARAVELDGYTFASKAEARRYEELRAMVLAGEIRNLVPHPRFALYAPKFDGPVPEDLRLDRGPQTSGWIARIGYYTADFAYETKDGVAVVEDVKSSATKTTAYRLRKKLIEATYSLTVTEVES